LGYPEDEVRARCQAALGQGWRSFKTKVGIDVVSDMRRCEVMREEIGDDLQLMADANQVWDVHQAIEWTNELRPYGLRWIEEPTHPDDMLGQHHSPRGGSWHGHRRARGNRDLQAARGGDDYRRPTHAGSVGSTVLTSSCCVDVPVCCHASGISSSVTRRGHRPRRDRRRSPTAPPRTHASAGTSSIRHTATAAGVPHCGLLGEMHPGSYDAALPHRHRVDASP
jgi:hypothetical protein